MNLFRKDHHKLDRGFQSRYSGPNLYHWSYLVVFLARRSPLCLGLRREHHLDHVPLASLESFIHRLNKTVRDLGGVCLTMNIGEPSLSKRRRRYANGRHTSTRARTTCGTYTSRGIQILLNSGAVPW